MGREKKKMENAVNYSEINGAAGTLMIAMLRNDAPDGDLLLTCCSILNNKKLSCVELRTQICDHALDRMRLCRIFETNRVTCGNVDSGVSLESCNLYTETLK